jgi:hypothetical protein
MSIEYWHITHQQLELTVAFLIVGVLLMLFALTGRWIREKLFLSEILVSLAAGKKELRLSLRHSLSS